jgi:probable rRNA maturation factor
VPGSAWGEIYVCVPVAARQASAMGHSLLTELLVLTAHGALHLSGMDDSTPELRRRMNERTARLLRRL